MNNGCKRPKLVSFKGCLGSPFPPSTDTEWKCESMPLWSWPPLLKESKVAQQCNLRKFLNVQHYANVDLVWQPGANPSLWPDKDVDIGWLCNTLDYVLIWLIYLTVYVQYQKSPFLQYLCMAAVVWVRFERLRLLQINYGSVMVKVRQLKHWRFRERPWSWFKKR